MNQADYGTDQELGAADDETPNGDILLLREKKQAASEQEPHADQKIVDDTDDLVTTADGDLFMTDVENDGVHRFGGVSLLVHNFSRNLNGSEVLVADSKRVSTGQ